MAAADPAVPSSESLTQGLAIVAVLVALLAAILPAATGRQQRLRDDRAKRSEMYLELIELVEGHGLWVVDRTYDLVATSDEDFHTEMPHRRTSKPERTKRVRARAIVSAYGSTMVSEAYSRWQKALEAFEHKLDEFSFIAEEEGQHRVDVGEAEPLRDLEVAARQTVADAVNAELAQHGRRKADHSRGN